MNVQCNAVTYRPAKLRIRTLFRGASRTAATSKIERFLKIVNGFQPLTIIIKPSILVVAAALDPPLLFTQSNVKWKAKNSELYNIHWKMFKIINSIFHSFILLLCFCFVLFFIYLFFCFLFCSARTKRVPQKTFWYSWLEIQYLLT